MPDVLAHDFIKACTANDTLERDEWGRGENMSRVNTKKYIAKIPFAIKACLLVAFLAGAIYFVVLMAMNAHDLYYFQHNIDTGNVGKTLHYLEWSKDGKLLTDQTFTIDLTPEQQSEISKYLKQMTEGGHLTFKRHELSNQVRIQFTNPGSPYFYRDAYSPDIRLFLRSENYEEGFEKLLAFVQQTKQEKISSIE